MMFNYFDVVNQINNRIANACIMLQNTLHNSPAVSLGSFVTLLGALESYKDKDATLLAVLRSTLDHQCAIKSKMHGCD
jgi:hypothetical protein